MKNFKMAWVLVLLLSLLVTGCFSNTKEDKDAPVAENNIEENNIIAEVDPALETLDFMNNMYDEKTDAVGFVEDENSADLEKKEGTGSMRTSACTVLGAPVSGAASIGSVSAYEKLNAVLEYEGSYYFVDYNTANGKKRGYVLKTQVNVTGGTVPAARIDINKTGKMTSAQTVLGGPDATAYASIGSVSSAESVLVLRSVVNSYYFIEYSTTSGKKRGYVKDYTVSIGTTSTPVSTTSVTKALYNNSSLSSKMSCGYNGYVSTPGRHEGIDFSYYQGVPIYSLVSGTVISVVAGYVTGGLSLIAIYDSSANKTVIYLHAAPSIGVGAVVSRGTKIGTESSRGTTAGHTHIEVRTGKQYYAAKSVNDYTLENPNPYSYWVSKGYSSY